MNIKTVLIITGFVLVYIMFVLIRMYALPDSKQCWHAELSDWRECK